MRKTLLLCFTLCAIGMMTYAQNCSLKLITGQIMQGYVIDATDTTLTFLSEGSTKEVIISASHIKSGTLPHRGTITIQDGKIVVSPNYAIHDAKQSNMANNPNYEIGKALKVSGATSLGIGVPCLAAGLITCIVGNVMHSDNLDDAQTKARVLEASYYLLPIGASLTIIGIPLYIEGKKIMDLNFNYTGNGIGMALNF